MIHESEIAKFEEGRKILTPYQRIIKAAAGGMGVRLSKWECAQMAADTAICDLAENDGSLRGRH